MKKKKIDLDFKIKQLSEALIAGNYPDPTFCIRMSGKDPDCRRVNPAHHS